MFKRFLSRCGAENLKGHSRFSLGRKGFGIVEVIIAMAVIAIVSAAAISIVLSSLRSAQRVADKERAEYFAADAAEAFRVSEDEDGFRALMKFAGYELIPSAGSSGSYTYTLESGFVATVIVDYTSRPELHVSVMDGGNEIAACSFQKGGTA